MVSAMEFWDRYTEAQGEVDPALHGTVTGEASVVRLRDRLERAHLLRVLPLTGRERVLDLGGGAGRLALWLAPRVGEVVLVDRSEALLARAKDRARREGVGNVRFVHADVASYAPEPEGFDVVLLFGVLTHLTDREVDGVVDRVADALRLHGRLAVKEPVTTDGVPREDRRPDEGYLARFRPREAYAEAFGRRLALAYQRPTCAHPIPAIFGGTNQAAAQAGRGATARVLEAAAPLWVAADPWVASVEARVRATPGLDRLLAPVPVLQDLYLFTGRLAPRRPRASTSTPSLSVVVIAFNEEECLAEVVEELRDDLDAHLGVPLEIVLVDDGSSDGTLAAMQRLAEDDPRLRVVPLSPNRGIGGALRAGFDAARGTHVTWVPGDGQIAPDAVRQLYARRDEAPMLTTVYAGRDDAPVRRLISATLNVLIRLRTREPAKSGGNYLFARTLWADHGPRGDDTMMLSTMFRRNLREARIPIAEVPIRARARVAGRSKVLNARTILRTLAATLLPRR
ncbi:MAG: glycosyltransferase [Sandaracinaceae bacterium]